MANPFRSAGRAAAGSFKKQAGKTLNQTGNSSENNADQMAAVFTNADRDTAISSLLGNPAEAQELERWDTLENILERAVAGVTTFGDSLKNEILPLMGTLFAPRGIVLKDVIATIPLISLDVATQLAKLGPVKLNGWEIKKLPEPYALIAKSISHHAEACINMESPFIKLGSSTAINLKSSTIGTRSDVLFDITKDYIARIANVFTVESNQIFAAAKQEVRIESNESIKLSASMLAPGAGIVLSKDGSVETSGTNTTQSSLVSHTIAANTSITISSGIVNINPVVPVAAKPGPIVVPVTPITFNPGNKHTPGQTVPQYVGQLGSGVVLVN